MTWNFYQLYLHIWGVDGWNFIFGSQPLPFLKNLLSDTNFWQFLIDAYQCVVIFLSYSINNCKFMNSLTQAKTLNKQHCLFNSIIVRIPKKYNYTLYKREYEIVKNWYRIKEFLKNKRSWEPKMKFQPSTPHMWRYIW